MKSPNLYNIFFSDKIAYRWKRHFLFWIAVSLYHLVRIGLMYPLQILRSDPFSLVEMVLYYGVFINVVFSYTMIYFLVPKYFHKKKYIQFGVGLLLLILLVQSLGAF